MTGQRRGRRGHRDGHGTVAGGVVSELASGVVPPGDGPAGGVHEHKVIAGAAIVVGHKLIGHPIVAQVDRLALGEIAEGAADEAQAGVFNHRQRGADRRGVVQRQIHGAAGDGESADGERHIAAAGVRGCQRIGDRTRDDDGVGQSRNMIRSCDHDVDGIVSITKGDRAAGAARGDGDAIDRHRGAGVCRGGSETEAGDRAVHGDGITVHRGTESGRERSRAGSQRGKVAVWRGESHVGTACAADAADCIDTVMIGGARLQARQRKTDGRVGAAGDRGRRRRHIGAVGGVQPVVKGDRSTAAIGVHRAIQHS